MATLPKLDLPSLRKREQAPKNRLLALVDLDGAVKAAQVTPRWMISMWFAAGLAVLPPIAFLASAHRGDGIAVVMKQELNKTGKLEQLTAEQRENFDRIVVPITTVMLPVGAAAKRQIWIFYCGLVVLAFLQGTRPHMTFQNTVAVAVVGAAPWFLHDVIAAVTLFHFDVGGIDPTNPVASNPAAWLFSGKDTRTPLAVFLRGVDFFELWGCVWMSAALGRHAQGRTSLPVVVVFGGHVAGVVKDVVSAAAASS